MSCPLMLHESAFWDLDEFGRFNQIVFDLLGDLYLLPIEGGQATSITNGLAWDMQPF